MKRAAFVCLGALLAAATVAQEEQPPLPIVRAAPVQSPFAPFDRAKFEAAAKRLGAHDAHLKLFGERAAEGGLSRAADELMRAAVPAFDAAVKLQEENDPAAAVELTKVLATATEPALRAHVRYHLARLFLDSDSPEHALQVLGDYLSDDTGSSPLDAEAQYFYAQALAELPMPDAAIVHLDAFLRWFPDAPERFRSAAHQRKGEIERQRDSLLHELADGMKKTKRDLRQRRTGKPTQIEQEDYVAKLTKLIEEQEERERQSSGAPSGNQQSSGPANQSALPEGGDGSAGNLDRRPSLADRWGDMKDEEREKIEAKVQKGLPPQYQKMLEEYYKKLGKAGGGQ